MIIELLTTWAIKNAVILASGSIGVFILTWILKKIPSEKIRKAVYDFSYKTGAAVSGFFTGWKYTKAIWENTLEPWLIGLFDMLIMAFSSGFFDGLRSDNTEK